MDTTNLKTNRPARTWLDPAAAAEYLGIAVETLADWRHRKTGPAHCYVSQRIVRYCVEDLDAYLLAHRVTPEVK